MSWTGEILVDGRNPWQEKKLSTITYAEYLEILEFRKVTRVRQCGEVLYFVRTLSGLKLYRAYFCKSRLCPLCAWRRMRKLVYENAQLFDLALAKYPHARFIFLTLTERNAELGKLRDALKLINQATNRFFKYKRIREVTLGYMRSSEITINRRMMTFHPHIHILMMLKSDYFVRRYIKQKELAQFWQRACRFDYVPIVHVERIYANQADQRSPLKEISKYQIKSCDYLKGSKLRNLEILAELEHALYKRRNLAYGGVFKQIRHKLKYDTVAHADNLLDITDLSELNGEEILEKPIFRWCYQVSRYLSWED